MAEENLMTQEQEREYHASHPNERRPNKFAKDGVKKRNTDYYSFWKSANAQTAHKIEEKKRLAREEEMKKRASKKKKGEVVNG